jgi:NhaA family Na+:H+ antiporter
MARTEATRQRARAVDRLTAPFQAFLELEAASSILLLLAALFALAWANSAWAVSYERLLHVPLALQVGGFRFELSFEHFVNDVLMAVFFFVVGMEIKRELVLGELASWRRALLPVVAAIGGMVAPAGIYAALHWDGPALRGWGIPMATDIAFAMAALSVFGSRVPPGLKVFLLALAIADDIGAVAVIAFFYGKGISIAWLGAALGALALAFALGRAGVRAYGVYVLVGAAAWFATHESGVHATIAGVALGLLTPARPLGQSTARELPETARSTLSPLDDLTHRIHPWVAFGIMPVFALCNAGVAFQTEKLASPDAARVGVAVAAGLLLGKPVGIALSSWLAVRLGLTTLPGGVGWSQIVAVGFLAGIGFTVALFVAVLAFEEPTFTAGAKVGIFAASAAAAILGAALLHRALPRSIAPEES